jgi:SAM-dependent methyltransferase
LARIDREFYRHHADEFDRTRGAPWSGWQPVAEWARRQTATSPLSILDLGCGNGRFGAFLADRMTAPFEQLGVDASLPLLSRARRAAKGAGRRARWLALDLWAGAGLDAVNRRFDLIVAFGLLHHVPGRVRRAQLMVQAASLLAPGGRLAVSCWQFAADPRFARRLCDPRRYVRERGEPVDGIEPDDHLLRWGALDQPDGPLRYCHHTSDREADELAASTGVPLVERYHADGRTGQLNLYRVFERAQA